MTRNRELILKIPPCDADYTDPSIQTISNVIIRDSTPCTNLRECINRSKIEEIQCTRRIAHQMAGFILKSRLDFPRAVEGERTEWAENTPDGKFWVNRDGKWQIIQGKENVINDIVAFAEMIIDRRPDEHLPFTRKGLYQINLGPAATIYSATSDFDDLLGETQERRPLEPFKGC